MLVPAYDEQSFSADVISRWGDLSEDLGDDTGLLHVQMAHLGRVCRSHPTIAGDILAFLEEVLGKSEAISEIENAVAISFLDWSEVDELGLRDTLPPQVSQIISGQWERMQRGV